jgi:hypothetical protein
MQNKNGKYRTVWDVMVCGTVRDTFPTEVGALRAADFYRQSPWGDGVVIKRKERVKNDTNTQLQTNL